MIRHLQKDHDAEWKLVLAASNRSAQAKTQRAEALVGASGMRVTHLFVFESNIGRT